MSPAQSELNRTSTQGEHSTGIAIRSMCSPTGGWANRGMELGRRLQIDYVARYLGNAVSWRHRGGRRAK